MKNEKSSGFTMGRRDFVKTSSIMAGGIMLSPGLLADIEGDRMYGGQI